MRNATLSFKHLPNRTKLNSKKARQLRILLESKKVKFITSPLPLKNRNNLQSLQKFSRTITSNYFTGLKTSIQVQIVGKPNRFRSTELLSPLFRQNGVPLSRTRLRKSLFYSTRFYETLLSNPSRVKNACRLINSPTSSFPPFLKPALHRLSALRAIQAAKLKRLTRRKVLTRFGESTTLPSSLLNSSLKPRKPKGPSFIKDHVQQYVINTYSNLPKTLSYSLRRPSSPLYGPFSDLSQRVLAQQSLVFCNWAFLWSKLTFLYTSFSLLPRLELYLMCRKAQKRVVRHHLRFRFKRQKLMLALADEPTRSTHMFVSPGLFLKYFQRKKSLKKNKSMKFLMVRFMRKVLLILRVRNVVINSRGVPLHLSSLLSVLFRPFSHHFEDPLTSTLINETEDYHSNINVSAIMFTSPRPFGSQKTRKMGRVKRKIRRRITRLGNVID